MSQKDITNPLLCNPTTGLCEIPSKNAPSPPQQSQAPTNTEKPIHILYFTDPICSSCWGIEAQLRRLKLEYGANFTLEYRMGGLLPSWDVYNSGAISKPSDVAHHWDEVSTHYDMPIDGDVWLEDPLPSSYPPSIAFKAAQMQDEKKAVLFMRRIREMVFLEKKNITKWEHLALAATQVDLDAAQLKADMEGPAKALFQADLELAKSLGVRSFPTLILQDSEQQRLVLKGVRPYEQFEQTILALYPNATKTVYSSTPEGLFELYNTLTINEMSVLSGLNRERAEQALRRLEQEKKIQQLPSKNGPIWVKNAH